MQDSHDVREVGLLVAFEEVLFESKGLEDEVDVFLIEIFTAVEGVEANRFPRIRWVNNLKILKPSRGLYMGQDAFEKVLIAFAIEDNHWHGTPVEATV